MYNFDISTSTISRITNAISSEVISWQNRPLDDLYLIVWMDGIVFKVRENSKIIYTTNLIENLNGKIRKYTKNKTIVSNKKNSFLQSEDK